MNNKEIKEKIENGYIHVKITLETISPSKAKTENTIKNWTEKIISEENIESIKQEIGDIVKLENENGLDKELYTGFAELEILVLGIEKLNWITFEFTPVHIEIIEPEEITFDATDFTDWLNDSLSKIQEIIAISREIGTQNRSLSKSFETLIKNHILSLLNNNIKNKINMAHIIGLPEKNLEHYLNLLNNENKIKYDKEKNKIELIAIK